MKNILIILLAIIICGFIYRFVGIERGLSYWNDESHTALMTRGIFEFGKPVTAIGRGGGLYQIAMYYVTFLSFKLFGVNEFGGRFPSIIAGTLLIAIAYFTTYSIIKKHHIALLTSLLVAFSQIQLAWSTQLRPYIWLELFTLLTTYFCYRFLQNKIRFLNINIALSLFFGILAVLFHGSGFISIAIVIFAIIIKMVIQKKYSYFLSLIPICLLSLLILRFTFDNAIPLLFVFDFRIWHYIAFFKEYIWLLVPAFFGALHLWYKDRNLFIVLPVFIIIIFALAIFKLSTQYVRYSLPAMPLLYILFSIGFFAMLDLFTFKQSKKTKIMITIVMLIGFIGTPIVKGKIIVWPKYYYSINNDVRENPIVDYKLAFQKIKEMIGDKQNVIVMDAWNDRVPYYLPGQKFIFLYRDVKKEEDIDSIYGEKMIKSIQRFKIEKNKYPNGIVLVENWMSQTPPELQDHIRKTLKHEFDVNNLPHNENDKWSISIYSWGF